jgi:hypothetical protein
MAELREANLSVVEPERDADLSKAPR